MRPYAMMHAEVVSLHARKGSEISVLSQQALVIRQIVRLELSAIVVDRAITRRLTLVAHFD